MLYVTTRNSRETYTVSRVLQDDRGPDGGQFVPFHMPCFSQEDVANLLELPFDQCAAQVLNRLLGLQLTGWDVSFYIGRYPVRIRSLGYRLGIAELWHNPDWCFDRLVRSFVPILCSGRSENLSQWGQIAVRIAVLAGICSECRRMGMEDGIDLAMVSGDFSGPISAWYARSWGFPIGNILCCCNENGNLWDLFSNGQMRTNGISIPTDLPAADVVLPECLERLICACAGPEEVGRYLDACRQGALYLPPDAVLARLRDGLYVSVVGSERIGETIPRAYASREYLLSPYDALSYCGVLDYRARFGETGPVLIVSERSPRCDSAVIAKALGISQKDMDQYF